MSFGRQLLSAALWIFAPQFGAFATAARVVATAVQLYDQRREQQKARNAAREAYNASLVDRLQTVDAQAAAPRRLVLGRVRLGGQMLRRPWSTGANRDRLTMVLEFAGHEVDAFESWYIDDTLVTRDANGWVQTAPWFKTRTETGSASASLDGSGAATVNLPNTPIAGTVGASWFDGDGQTAGTLTISVSGSTVTLSGGPGGGNYSLSYQYTGGTSLVRIRPYVGTATQSVGADLASEYPGDVRSTDHYRGIALAVVDLVYDTDVFTAGPPQISAVVRGARVLDVRTSTTAWSENPALLAYHYARHANGLALPSDELRTSDWIEAANVCDASTNFTVRKPGGSPETVTLPRYRAGMVIDLTADPVAQLSELIEAMAGRMGWQGGVLRVRAGALRSTVSATIDEGWVHQVDGSNQPFMKITDGVPRAQKINSVTGTCVDPSQRYQLLPFPRVADQTLIDAEGSYQLEVEFGAVTHIAHAQHLASIMIREGQAALRVEMLTGLDGYRAELFDVFPVTMPRYGWTNKLMEVTGWRWSPVDGVTLRLAEVSSDIWSPAAELVGRDPAPNSNLPNPWDVPTPTGVAVTSNTAGVADGSVLTRLVVTWNAIAQLPVAASGRVEVQYIDQSQALPAGDWPSWEERGDATRAVIPGVVAGRPYLVRVRAVRSVPYVTGNWSTQVLHIAAAPPLVKTAGLAAEAASSSVITDTSLTTGSIASPGASGRTVGLIGPQVTATSADTLDINVQGVHKDTFWSSAAYAEVQVWISTSDTFGGTETEITTIRRRFNAALAPSGNNAYFDIAISMSYVPPGTKYYICKYKVDYFDSAGAAKQCGKDFEAQASWYVVRRKR